MFSIIISLAFLKQVVYEEEGSCQQFHSSDLCRQPADLLFASRFYEQFFCHQQICFMSVNVVADIMEMTLTPIQFRASPFLDGTLLAFGRRAFSLQS
jgi:hypothetical protein